MSQRCTCGERGDSRDGLRLWLDWKVLEEVNCKYKILYLYVICTCIIYSLYNFYADEYLNLFNSKKNHNKGTTY